MYEKIEGGSSINIQGLECQLPPQGYIFNTINKKVEYRGIYERSSVKAEQFWERIPLPDWYESVMKAWAEHEQKRKEADTDFYDERLEEYKRQEWDRRLNGMWFMNNGVPHYLVGSHYMYLQWWSIDIGYVKYRLPDLEYFYFLQYCIEDPNCMGALEVTKRRFGKTFRGGLFVTEYVTRTKMTNGTIQSKTGQDAKKVFSKAIVNPFRKLPRFFRPEYDMSLGVNPKTELRFQKTNVRGKKAEDDIDKEELGSVIDWHSADPLAQDGMKVHRSFQDEWAKTYECDIYQRHEVMRYCVVDDEGKIIGKLLYSSTVEKLVSEKVGVQDGAKMLWDDSDQLNKGENGRTSSGLYRFFMSAKRAKNFDKYGIPNEEKTLKEIMADRETVKDNQRSLFARIRKEPLTIEEAFSIDAETCVFNSFNIAKREKELSEKPVFKRSVLFYRGEDQKVRWREVKASEDSFHWKVTWMPPKEEQNKYVMSGKLKKPDRTHDGAISVDSYSNSQGGRKYGSKASAWIGRKYLISDPEHSGKAIGHLYGRPSVKDTLHEQVMLASEFYGYYAWYEHTADDYEGYFRERGKKLYLGVYPLSLIAPDKREDAERHKGTPITPFSLTRQLDNGIAYFEFHCDKIDFEEVLTTAKVFDPYDRTAYDCIVSFLILISVLMEPFRPPEPPKECLIPVYEN